MIQVGLTISTDDLDDLCRMMCDNELPRRKKMKKQVVLEPDDVRQTIANSFNVGLKDVEVKTKTVTCGFGAFEHDEPTFEVVVTLPMNETR